jgi:hypothetical protein
MRTTCRSGRNLAAAGPGQGNRSLEHINLVRNSFGAEFHFGVNATIKERLPLDSDPEFDSCAQSHEPVDDDNLPGLYHPFNSSIPELTLSEEDREKESFALDATLGPHKAAMPLKAAFESGPI